MNDVIGKEPDRKTNAREIIMVIILGFLIFSFISPGIKCNRDVGKRMICGTNLFNLGKAMWMYCDDFGDYPAPEKWCDLLLENGNVTEEMFKCPGNKKQRCSFAMNPNAKRNAPGDLVVLLETKGGWNQVGGTELLTSDNHQGLGRDGVTRQGLGCNVFFNDGHVEFVKAARIGELKWDVEKEEKLHARNARRPEIGEELEYWLANMVWHHRYSNDEICAATGLAEKEIEEAKKRFDIRADNRPERADGAPLLVLPYPGGRHPRIGFLEGAIDPQRETKFSAFAPWDANSYVVVDAPEAIWSNLGLTYLAHTHIDTIWAKQGIELKKLEWNRHEDGGLDIERRLPNGISFGVKVKPTKDAVLMEMRLANGTGEKLSDLRIQNCVMTKMAKGFEQQTNENKVLKDPYAACRSSDGKRWIITAWQGCHRTWANEKCPCFHSDPKFTDLEPGQEATLKGWLSFYEGTDTEAELARIKETGWEEK